LEELFPLKWLYKVKYWYWICCIGLYRLYQTDTGDTDR